MFPAIAQPSFLIVLENIAFTPLGIYSYSTTSFSAAAQNHLTAASAAESP
jgi:hypothetical protein